MKLCKEGSPKLLRKSEEVPETFLGTDKLREYTDEMLSYMLELGGVGMSAPQIGNNFNLFVMGDDTGESFVCINPTIVELSKSTIVYTEGCLSYPELFLPILRPESAKVKYLDINGLEKEVNLDGIWARIYQHEYDHLHGILFTTRNVSKLKLQRARAKQKKALKRPSFYL